MKKSLRFAVLVGILSLTGGLALNARAQAYPSCETLNQSRCTNAGEYTDCYWVLAQEQIVCQCDGSTMTWTCFF